MRRPLTWTIHETALKDVDKEFVDQLISLAVVTISDEESEIDILA